MDDGDRLIDRGGLGARKQGDVAVDPAARVASRG